MPKNGTDSASLGTPSLPTDNAGPGSTCDAPAAPGPQGRGLATTFRSLRHRNYRLYFFGQLVSLMGTWMQSTAVSWLAFALTHESKWTALILVAQILPTFFFGGLGGILADRVPKRTLIFCTQSAFLLLALLLAGLGYAGVITPWKLVIITAFSGLVQALDLPARLAFVMDMASREDLMNAVALNSLLFNVARALGPAAGGQLMRWISPETCFVANALSYLAVLWALALMNVAHLSPARMRRASWRSALNVLVFLTHHKEYLFRAARMGVRSFFDGLIFVVRRRELLLLALLMAVISFCGWPSQTLLPALSKLRLSSDEVGYSWMLSGTGVGALLAAWTIATFGSLEHGTRMLGAGIGIVIAGLILLSLADTLALAVGCSALIGFGLILFLATSQSIVQLSSGDHNRGRVMAVWAMIQSGAVPLGSILAGVAADRWGVPLVLRFLGLGCLAAALLLLVAFGIFRSAATPQEDEALPA